MHPERFVNGFLLFFTFLFLVQCTGPLVTKAPVGELPKDPREGRPLYIRNGCFQCHGTEGHGDGMMAPSLKNKPRDFRDLAHYKGGTSPRDLAFTIKYASQWKQVTNQSLAGMPDYSHLPDEELLALGAWVHALQTSAK